jgi:hypothetical protein
MFIRVSKLRVVVASLLFVGFGGLSTSARASSIASSDANAIGANSATSTLEAGSTFAPPDDNLSQAPTLTPDLVADVGLTGTQPQLALLFQQSTETAAVPKTSPAAPTFLTEAALPLNLSDVPEPTAFGLLLLGLAGLFAARRVARKA